MLVKPPLKITILSLAKPIDRSTNLNLLHISDFGSKIIHFTGIISLYARQKSSFHAHLNENNIYFSHILFKIFNVVTTGEFSIHYKIIL